MSLTFFYAPQSSASPTHWILEELKVPCEKVQIDIKAGDQKKPQFLEINPNGKVPVLVHDGTAIFESVAIAIYLGETFGVERGLYPAPGPQRGTAMKWLVWCNVTLGEAFSRMMLSSSDRTPKEMHNEAVAKAARADVERLLGILNDELKTKDHLLGADFSIVDAHLASWVDYIGMCGIDLKAFANLAAWHKRCHDRPASAVP